MAAAKSLARLGSRYAYLAAFLALLSGVFHPFIAGSSLVAVLIGVAVLFGGLAGGVLLHRAATVERRPGRFVSAGGDLIAYRTGPPGNRRVAFLAGGFVVIGVSLAYVYELTGRV